MNILAFDLKEKRLRNLDRVLTCEHLSDDTQDSCRIAAYFVPEDAHSVAFSDMDGRLQLFTIKNRLKNAITGAIDLYCEHAIFELNTELPIIDLRPTQVQAGVAVTQALTGTRWQLGLSVPTAQMDTRWWYQSPMAALNNIAEVWGVRLVPRISVNESAIVARYIDVISAVPVWRGKRFELGKDLVNAEYEIDTRDLVTAILPLANGEEDEEGFTHYLGIDEVIWSKAAGDPADKPAGQKFIENLTATQLHSVTGSRPIVITKTYDDVADAQELIRAAWADLEASSVPVMSGRFTAVDLERIGFPHEAARLNDQVAFIVDGYRALSTIVAIKREYTENGKDVFTFGEVSDSLVLQQYQTSVTAKDALARSAYGLRLARVNPQLLDGIIDTTVTKILSSATTRYTDADGGDVYVTSDGLRAIKLTGSGILCADTKIGEVWQWRTAIDGQGIVADLITAGTLQANLIKILGTDQFYWDSDNIYILNPENTARQIRIGRYDGVNYGIAFTTDSGNTWQNAIGFDGLNISPEVIQSISENVTGQQLVITWTNGTILDETLTATTGSIHVYNNGQDITHYIPAELIHWQRISDDPVADAAWNADPLHQGVKSIQISAEDIYFKGVIRCNIDEVRIFSTPGYDDGSLLMIDNDTGDAALFAIVNGELTYTGEQGYMHGSGSLMIDLVIGAFELDTQLSNLKTAHMSLTSEGFDLYAQGKFNARGGMGSDYVGMSNNHPDGYAFWTGAEDPALAPFYAKRDGTVRATMLQLNNSNITEFTQMWSYNEADNADADNPIVFKIFVPEECSGVQSLKISFTREPFRAYSMGAESGGASDVTSRNGGGSISGPSNAFTSSNTVTTNTQTILGNDHYHTEKDGGETLSDAILRRGSSGPLVQEMQQTLITLGYNVGSNTRADGKFGSATEAAVKAFQRDYRLPVTGTWGMDELQALDADLEEELGAPVNDDEEMVLVPKSWLSVIAKDATAFLGEVSAS